MAEYSTAAPPTNPTTNYTATDQLGSPRVITNALGQVTSRRDFLPFGEELSPDGNYRKTSDKYGATDSVRQRFTGYQKDTETGLDFAEARYYNNQHGRFTAVDPLLASGKSANPQTFNRYAYVLGNPLKQTDPTGLQVGSSLKPCQTGSQCVGYAKNRNVDFNNPIATVDVIAEPTAEQLAVQTLVGGFNQRLNEIADGSKTGVANAGISLYNGTISTASRLTGVSFIFDPPQFERYNYNSAAGERFGTAIEFNAMVAPAIIGGVGGGGSSPSVVPQGNQFASPAVRALSNDALVVRGGQNLPENFANGSGVTIDSAGNLNGVSVNSGNGLTVQELSTGVPHNQIGVTTVGNVRALGGDVIPSATRFNPNHCTLCGITQQQASNLFRPTIRTPR